MSLQRLINLAKRTGDRLIVHDPMGQDVVILSIDDYEQLHDDIQSSFFSSSVLDDVDEGTEDIEDESPWHSTEELIEERYQNFVKAHSGHHNRQYGDEDWEEASALAHRPSVAPLPPEPDEVQEPAPIAYLKQDHPDMPRQGEQQLDEPVFYEEPV